jgi:betaine lipid synthase
MEAIARLQVDPVTRVWAVLAGVVVFVGLVFLCSYQAINLDFFKSHTIDAYIKFAWSCFFKPHTGDASRNQQDALESFYKAQAGIYDTTRSILLKGREEMLGLVAAQLKHKTQTGEISRKPIWVDVSF